MIAIILTSFGTLFAEVANTIGKDEVQKKKESMYTMGFLNLLFGTIFFFAIAIGKGSFQFSLASLPTFTIRAILEVIITYTIMASIIKADRTTFSFLRIITVPLILGTDMLIGYDISILQIIGISILVLTLIFLLMNHGISRKGSGLVLISALLAVATISLYKYNITHFNSVEAEQGIIYLILMFYFIFGAKIFAKENPFRFLKNKIHLTQSGTHGIASVLESFAYSFAPPSIIMAAKRSSAVLWSIISGNVYFKEKHPLIKIIAFLFIIIGMILLIK